MKKIDDIKLHLGNTVKEAMAIIDKGSLQFAVVVDDDLKLLGVLTDGDIRRGLLRGLGLESSIESLINKHPVVANINDTKERILELANE